MAYKLLKPETDVWSAVRKHAKTSWWFWGFVAAYILERYFFDSDVFLGLVMLYIMYLISNARNVFWSQVAKNNGWKYKGDVDDVGRHGIMFKQGNKRDITHFIEGEVDGRTFRMFNYSFKIGSDKNGKSYWYTVFAFKFEGTFPHIYLNNKHNSYSINVGEKLPLPLEFEKQFTLSVARKYEVEALEIFTSDIFMKLLDGGFTHDIELVDHELIMFVDGNTDNFKKLEEEFNKAMELEDLFDEKLDKFKFHPIGDNPHQLK